MRYVKHNLGSYFGYPMFIMVPEKVKEEEIIKIITAFNKTLNDGYSLPLAMQTHRELIKFLKPKK